ncbi:hypothetical protein D3C84_1188280 [compost metagenome]
MGAGFLLEDVNLAVGQRLHPGGFVDLVFQALLGDAEPGSCTVLAAGVFVRHLGHHLAAAS